MATEQQNSQGRHPTSPPQQPESPAHRGVCGEPRGPLGDKQKYDKHGGKLDHDGKAAKSMEPPKRGQQDMRED